MEVWLDMRRDLKYMSEDKHAYFLDKYEQINRMLNSMIDRPEKFCH